ncbi:hypothetical protein JL720_13107 [Aureococcus anophagefferens]|nr:hypothetical protein JL720_13107 [Aureococcus anophagefferens]
MVERMDRPLSFEEYFEQNDSRVGKSPASARKTAREAPRSAGAVYEERTPRRSASARERAAPATGTPYRSAPSPHRAGARPPAGGERADDATSGKRRVDNIIEGLTSGSQLSDLEQLRLFEDLEREVDRFRHKEHLTDAEAREAHHVSSVALEFMKHEHHNWKEKHRSTQSEKKASAAFRIKSLLRSWYITKKLSRAPRAVGGHEKRERGLRHALRVWHVGITRSNIDAEGCVRGIGLVSRAWRRQWRQVLAASLSTWRSRAVVEERNRFALVRGLGAVRRALERATPWRLHRDAAIRREAEALVAKRRAEAAAMKCRLRFLRALEHRAWNAWVGHVGERKRLRSALKHATLRFRHSKVAPALGTWRLFAQKAADADRDGRNKSRSATMVDRAIRRASRRRLAAAVHTWKDVLKTDSERSLLARLEAQSRRNDLFARIATSVHDPLRALKRLERLDVWPAVRTWKENFAALRDAEVSAARMAKGALRAMTSVETRWLRRGMASWRAPRRRGRVQKLVARWKASKLAAGVRTWRDHGRARKCLKDAAALVAKALGRMKKVEWARAARAATASRRKILKVVSKLRHRATAAVSHLGARGARRAALEAKMVRVILRLGHRAAAGALASGGPSSTRTAARSGACSACSASSAIARGRVRAWFDACKKERLLEQRVLHVLLKMVHRAAAAGFRRWAFVDRSLRRSSRGGARVLSRMSHRRLVAALNQWKLVEAFASQLETKARVLRVVCRMAHIKLWAAFDVWAAKAAERRAGERKMARFVRRLSHRAAGAAMRQWVDVQRFERRAEAKIGKTLRRMEHRSAGLAWTQWRNVVAPRRGEARVLRCLGRMGHRAAALALMRWAAVVAHLDRVDDLLRAALLKMSHRRHAAALRRWTFAVRVALANERKMERVILRVSHRALAAALAQWLAALESDRRVERGPGRFAHRRTAAALRQWVLANRRAADVELKTRRVANEAVRQWAAVVAAERAKEATMTRALLKMLASMEAAGWRRWVYVFRRSADAERKMTRVLKHVLNAFAAAGWNQWVAQVARLADAEATVVRVLKHMLHRAASQAWRAWHGRVVELRVLSIHASAVRESAKGLRQWVRAVGSEKRDRLDVLRRIGRCAHDPRALRRLNALDAWTGWRTWVLATAELRALAERQRAACDVVLRLFADGDARKRRAGWLSWRLHQRTMVRLDHLFGRWTHSKQAAGFSAWVDVYMRALDRDRAGAPLRAPPARAAGPRARAAHLGRLPRGGGGGESRGARAGPHASAAAPRLVLRQGDRRGGLRRWAEAVRDRRRAEAIVVKTLSHMSHRTLHLAWMAWRAARGDGGAPRAGAALRGPAVAAPVHSTGRRGAGEARRHAGLMRWISFASRSRRDRCAIRRRQDGRRVLRRCQSRSLSRGFHAWSTVMFEDSASSLSAKLRAEQARTTMFGRLATSAHDPLRALKRLDKLGAWTGLRTWKAATDLARAAADARHRGARARRSAALTEAQRRSTWCTGARRPNASGS